MSGYLDRCVWLATSTGTVDFVEAGAITGFQTMETAGAVDQQTYDYAAQSADLSQWEYGTGTWTTATSTLARTTVRGNSLGTTAKINFTTVPQLLITKSATAEARTPTVQSLTSGTGATYTTPANVQWIEVFMVGGGGGGAGASTTTNVVGSTGGTSTFNSINAAGGSGGGAATTSNGSIGGAGGTGGTGTATRRTPGGPGGSGFSGTSAATAPVSGPGGVSYFGGGAIGVASSVAGVSAAANTGAGGSGAWASGSNSMAGGGGGAGEFVYLIIANPAATYTYTIGAVGAGGVSTNNGGAGGTGFIFVIEHYD